MLKITQKRPIGFETLYLGKSNLFFEVVILKLIFELRYALVLEDKAAKKVADSSKPGNEQIETPKAETEPVR